MDYVNAEWTNLNAGRVYPFREDSSLLSDEGAALPNRALLDAALSVPSSFGGLSVYMSSFTLAGGVATAAFSDAATDDVIATASAAGSAEIIPAAVTGVGVHDDVGGSVVFGSVAKLAEGLPDGIYRFKPASSMLEPRCVVPAPPCLSGIYVSDMAGSSQSTRLRGDVALVGGNGVRLSVDVDMNAVVISADPDRSFACDCESDHRACVKAINGISIENVTIEGDGSCVDVETDATSGVVRITDNCSKPCCGCAELTFLNEKTNSITTAIGRLEAFAQALSSRMEEFATNVLLSQRSAVKYI